MSDTNERRVKASIDKLKYATEHMAEAVVLTALQHLIADAQMEKPSKHEFDADSVNVTGGRMPVETGALRSSLIMELHGGTLTIGEKDGVKGFDETRVIAGLADWSLGTQIMFGWTQHYAAHIEYGTKTKAGKQILAPYRYLGEAVDRWQHHVDLAVQEIELRSVI